MSVRGPPCGCRSVLFPGEELPWCPVHGGRDKGAPTCGAAVVTGDSDPSSHTYCSLRHRRHLTQLNAKENDFTVPLTAAGAELR